MKQLEQIWKEISTWKLEDVEGEVFAEFELFQEQCISKNNCFDQNVASAFMGIRISISNVLISSAAKHTNAGILDSYVPVYYKASLLHYRMMQKYISQVEKSELYARMLDSFAFLCCLSIYLGDEEANFLCREYIRHIDSEYNCPFSVDKFFMLFCYRLARWKVDGDFSYFNEKSSGIYNNLLEFRAEDVTSKIVDILNARVESAYLQLVKNKNIEPTFYNTEFPALFPFEILAFMKLANIELNAVQHPLLYPFKSRKYALPESYKNKFDVCEQKIATL